MIGRFMAPAIEKMAAIDVSKFICAIVVSELALRNAISKMKSELFRGDNDRS